MSPTSLIDAIPHDPPKVLVTGKKMQSHCPECLIRRKRIRYTKGPLHISQCTPDVAVHSGRIVLAGQGWQRGPLRRAIRQFIVSPIPEGDNDWYECQVFFWCSRCHVLTPIPGMHYRRKFSPARLPFVKAEQMYLRMGSLKQRGEVWAFICVYAIAK